jgi:hypothetical protein
MVARRLLRPQYFLTSIDWSSSLDLIEMLRVVEDSHLATLLALLLPKILSLLLAPTVSDVSSPHDLLPRFCSLLIQSMFLHA